MQLPIARLKQHLARTLSPVYVLSGDEPLQLTEAFDAILCAARARGFVERTVIDADSHFDWNALIAQGSTFSLFSEKKIIDLRLASPKPGNQGERALVGYAENLPVDTLMVITTSQLDARTRRSRWYQVLEKHGVTIQLWPIEIAQLPAWLQRRLRERGIEASHEALLELASRGEGNLLAAAQEIERLIVLLESPQLDLKDVLEHTHDQARFEPFDLVDATLVGSAKRAVRILRGLQREAVSPPVVIGTLAWQLRVLNTVAIQLHSGMTLDDALRHQPAWLRRRQGITIALKRIPARQWGRLIAQLFHADATAKGMYPADPWIILEGVVLGLCGLEGFSEDL